ncbi:hypothetical protein [Coleofasciculus sp. F4-SAH-05]|uniref:hypothetical protein n=1 Tax=Coleofasciculus TaxID=669368 RepID=UPI0032F8AD9E
MSQPSQQRNFLANTQLWRGLPDEQLDAIAMVAIAKSYHKGEVILFQSRVSIPLRCRNSLYMKQRRRKLPLTR